MSWSDHGTRAELAAALDMVGDRAPVVTLAAKALRDGETSHELADALDDHAHLIAIRWGNYDGHGVCSDAAEALRPVDDEPEPDEPPAPTGPYNDPDEAGLADWHDERAS